MAKGIYKITNNRTGEVYIGQTNNLYFREKQHMEDLANRTHHNFGMQQDYNRGDTFSFEVLEYVNGSRKELHEREKAQIRNHNSFYAGYNQTPGGEYDQYKGTYQQGGGRKQTYSSRRSYSTVNSSSTYKSKSSPKSNNNDWACVLGAIFIFIFSGICGSIGESLFKGLGMLFTFIGMILGVTLFMSLGDGGSNTTKSKKYKNSEMKWKNCPKCSHRLNSVAKICPYCYYKFK